MVGRFLTRVVLGLLISFFIYSTAIAVDVVLEWDANTETDLAGYRVYRAELYGGTYTQIGSDIPCTHGDSTCATYTDTNVPTKTYCYKATAYDSDGNESGYSNRVCYSVGLNKVKRWAISNATITGGKYQ